MRKGIRLDGSSAQIRDDIVEALRKDGGALSICELAEAMDTHPELIAYNVGVLAAEGRVRRIAGKDVIDHYEIAV